MIRTLATGLALALLSSAAQAQSPPNCAAFQREFDRSIDEASRANAEKLFDGRTAIQAAQIDAVITSSLALAKLNLDLMAAAKCPLPSAPIALTSYYPVAKRCLTVRGDENCVRRNWRPEP